MMHSKNKYLKAVILAIAALAIASGFISCGVGDFFGYCNERFIATVEYEFDGILYKAKILSDNPDAIDDHPMLTVKYLYPESLNGIIYEFYGNSVHMRFDNVEEVGKSCEGILVPFKALIPETDYSSVKKLPDGSFEVSVHSEMFDLKYTFDKDGSFPQSVCGSIGGKRLVLKILSFEIL